jgi:hypothetical protein
VSIFDPATSFINQKMAATLAKFASIPVKYAPKRKVLEFAAPQWKNKLGEFSDPDVLGWINRLYQDKAFPTREAFNKAYDEGRAAAVSWRNKTMVLTKEDVDNLEEEFNGGGFDGSQAATQKMLTKMRAALETGEKVIFVY